MPHHQHLQRRSHGSAHLSFTLTVLLASLLSACGGGGGGEAQSPVTPPVVVTPPASSTQTALSITANNAEAASVLAISNGAIALAAAQMTVDLAATATSSSTLTKPCGSNGSQTIIFSDNDGNARVSAGDKLVVTYAYCYSKELDGIVDGTMSATFATPANGQQLSGTLSFSPGFGDHTSIPREELGGSLRFDYASGEVSKLLRVSSDVQAFNMVYTDGAVTKTDIITALDAQHELRIDTARATTSMRYRLASNLLGGSIDVSTTTPLRSWFDTLPDAGELTVTGAGNSKASLRVNPNPAMTNFNVLLGDTVVTSLPSSGTGYLWSSGAWLAQNASLASYTIKPDLPASFKVLIEPDTANMAPNGALTWTYTRTLGTPLLRDAQFREVGSGFVSIPGIISQNGAMLTVKPASQLKAGATYNLVFDRMAPDSVRDNAGNGLSTPFGTVEVKVKRTISASIDMLDSPALLLGPGATLTVDASKSSANGRPVSSLQWRQLSGPALTIANPAAARLTLSTAAPAKGVAVIELTVSNAANETDKQQFSIDVLTDLSTALVFSYTSGNGKVTIDSNAATAAPPYARYVADINAIDIGSTKTMQRLLLGLPGTLRWQAGLSTSFGTGNSDGVSGRYLGEYSCSSSNGNFRVLDFALDTAGNLSRVAIDLDENCAGGTVNKVSIRYGSDMPLRK